MPVGMTWPVAPDLEFGLSGAKPRPRSQVRCPLAKHRIWDAASQPVSRLNPTAGVVASMRGGLFRFFLEARQLGAGRRQHPRRGSFFHAFRRDPWGMLDTAQGDMMPIFSLDS
jgi:hypothetical protein